MAVSAVGRGRRLRPQDRGDGAQAEGPRGRGAGRASRWPDLAARGRSAMNSTTTARFRELLTALPAHVQKQARESYRLFRLNPSHPGLRFKQVHDEPPIYSARVGIGYRAVGQLDGGTVIWFWIGTHAEYDLLLSQL